MLKTFNFEQALSKMKKGELVSRACIKNDAVMLIYKDRLYQMSKGVGVRYPYIPTNKDIMSEDWHDMDFEKIEQIQQ